MGWSQSRCQICPNQLRRERDASRCSESQETRGAGNVHSPPGRKGLKRKTPYAHPQLTSHRPCPSILCSHSARACLGGGVTTIPAAVTWKSPGLSETPAKGNHTRGWGRRQVPAPRCLHALRCPTCRAAAVALSNPKRSDLGGPACPLPVLALTPSGQRRPCSFSPDKSLVAAAAAARDPRIYLKAALHVSPRRAHARPRQTPPAPGKQSSWGTATQSSSPPPPWGEGTPALHQLHRLTGPPPRVTTSARGVPEAAAARALRRPPRRRPRQLLYLLNLAVAGY